MAIPIIRSVVFLPPSAVPDPPRPTLAPLAMGRGTEAHDRAPSPIKPPVPACRQGRWGAMQRGRGADHVV